MPDFKISLVDSVALRCHEVRDESPVDHRCYVILQASNSLPPPELLGSNSSSVSCICSDRWCRFSSELQHNASRSRSAA